MGVRIFFTYIFLVFCQLSFAQLTQGTKNINGQEVRVHKVQKGETLYAISRKYNVPVAELLKINPKAGDGLDIGQEVYLPKEGDSKTVERQSDGKTHTVSQGETLFSISRHYNIEVSEIKKANGMKNNEISVGQALIIPSGNPEEEIVEPTKEMVVVEETTALSNSSGEASYTVKKGETLFAISRKTGVSVSDIKKWNDISGNDISEGQVLKLKAGAGNPVLADGNAGRPGDPVAETKEKTTVEKNTDPEKVTPPQPQVSASKDSSFDEFVEVMEKGVAELIPDTNDSRKYLALHRTAKPGTIIRVRNDMNGKEVWARVIGPLPDTGDNKGVLIKLSQAAYERLGALDKKFRVTITYIP